MSTVTQLTVNGKTRNLSVEGDRSLLSVLRDDLDLTGAKYGCGEGHCGACTVLINGTPTRSCVTKVGTVTGAITTVEGLEKDGVLHPVQEAFLEAGAMQCGYCTSGMIMAACALLEKTPNPRERDILRAMNGNVCRCGTYQRISAAIEIAAKAMRKKSK